MAVQPLSAFASFMIVNLLLGFQVSEWHGMLIAVVTGLVPAFLMLHQRTNTVNVDVAQLLLLPVLNLPVLFSAGMSFFPAYLFSGSVFGLSMGLLEIVKAAAKLLHDFATVITKGEIS